MSYRNLDSREYKTLRYLLKFYRKEANLTQNDLAKKINFPQSFISKYESGERRLDFIEVRKIISAIGISIQEFLSKFEEEINETK